MGATALNHACSPNGEPLPSSMLARDISRWHLVAWLTEGREVGASYVLDSAQSCWTPGQFASCTSSALGASGAGPLHQSPPTQAHFHLPSSGHWPLNWSLGPSAASIPPILHYKFNGDHIPYSQPSLGLYHPQDKFSFACIIWQQPTFLVVFHHYTPPKSNRSLMYLCLCLCSGSSFNYNCPPSPFCTSLFLFILSPNATSCVKPSQPPCQQSGSRLRSLCPSDTSYFQQ